MVHGRQGFKLEAFKFSLYLFIPVAASLGFNNPVVQQTCADYFQFLKFPANPNTRLKEEFDEIVRKRDMEREQRLKYMEQLKALNESAQRITYTQPDEQRHENKQDEDEGQKSSRYRWWWSGRAA